MMGLYIALLLTGCSIVVLGLFSKSNHVGFIVFIFGLVIMAIAGIYMGGALP